MEHGVVKEDQAEALAKKYNWGFSIVSAKSDYQIGTLFQSCANYSANKGSVAPLKNRHNIDLSAAGVNDKYEPEFGKSVSRSYSVSSEHEPMIPNTEASNDSDKNGAKGGCCG